MCDREKRIDQAKEYFLSGYNCTQSTALPFYDLVGIDKATLKKVASVFGGGVAGLKEVCGVITGITMVVGLNEGDIDVTDKELKDELKLITQDLISKFLEANDTINCGELLDDFEKNPISTDESSVYYKKPCLKLVEDGARILCDYFYK